MLNFLRNLFKDTKQAEQMKEVTFYKGGRNPRPTGKRPAPPKRTYVGVDPATDDSLLNFIVAEEIIENLTDNSSDYSSSNDSFSDFGGGDFGGGGSSGDW